MSKDTKLTGLEIPLVLAVISLFCWNSPILLPAKLLTVFFHELSHGIAAILTGGHILRITLNMQQGGVCYFTGGWFLITATAGYLGSLLWGSGILLASLKKGISRGLTEGIAVLLLIAAALWMRDFQALTITITTAFALIFVAAKLKEVYCDIFLKYISLISCFYVIFDIKDDLLDRSIPASDAYQISARIFPGFMTSIGSYIIGLLWMATAIFILYKVFNYAFNTNRK